MAARLLRARSVPQGATEEHVGNIGAYNTGGAFEDYALAFVWRFPGGRKTELGASTSGL